MATRIIAFVNNKGGIARTTSIFNIAYGLQKKNKKVLCIDLDAQGNLSLAFNIKPENMQGRSVSELLKGEATATECLHTIDNIDIIPSNLTLSFTELELFTKPKREETLKRFIEPIKNNYDFILLDTAPNLLLLTQNALTLATELLTPTEAGYFALNGVAQLFVFIRKQITDILNPNLIFDGAFITKYNTTTTLTKDVEAEYKRILQDNLLTSKIRRDVKLEESPSYHKSIYDYAPKSKGAEDYEALTTEIIALHD